MSRPYLPAGFLLALALGIGFALALACAAAPAAADDAVVVLDRGRMARAEAHRHEQLALRLVTALSERAFETRLVLYGTRPDGRVRASVLSGDLVDRLARAAAKEGWRYEGETDPRHALAASLAGTEGTAPLIVVLVGPFGAEAPEGEADDPRSKALGVWTEKAPTDVRVFAPDLSAPVLARIAEARGVVATGGVVLGCGGAVGTPAPWSPLAATDEERVLVATVRVPLELLTVGDAPREGLLAAASSDGRGTVEWTRGEAAEDEAGVAFAVSRASASDDPGTRVETVAFSVVEDPRWLWLADAPQPRTIQWTTVRPDARITWFADPDGRTRVDPGRPLDAATLHVGQPLARLCRVEHTRVGAEPVWRVAVVDGELPAGWTVEPGEVVNLTDEIARRDLAIRVEPHPGVPGRWEGSVVIEADGHPRRFVVPFRLVVPLGRIVAHLEAPADARRLPTAGDSVPWALYLEEEAPNAPRLVRVEAVLDPPSLASSLTARLAGTGSVELAWDLAGPLALRPGRRYALHLDLAPGVAAAEGTLTLRLPDQRGVEGRVAGSGRVVTRSPRLRVAKTPWAYRMDGGEVVADPPLVLEVDADGGGGSWRLALLETEPVLEVAAHAPARFALQPAGPGRWVVVPDGAWRGARGDTFSPREERIHLRVDWKSGPAPEDLSIAVEVRPRWGAAGWILAVLAALALALGLWGLLQLRAAPVEGTLLYQVEGRRGAVGRLDLGRVGRHTTPVHADAAGRLTLGGAGDAGTLPVVVVRPTRVGGLLEIPSSEPLQRHLLVDGLTVTAGRHRIRYVSSQPGEGVVPNVDVPGNELLGPEFDLPTGRIDALEREGPPAPDEP